MYEDILSIFGFSENKGIFRKVGSIIDKGFYLPLNAFATIFAGVFAGILFSDGVCLKIVIYLSISLIVLIYSQLGNYNDIQKLSKAKEKNKADLKDLSIKYDDLSIESRREQGNLRKIHKDLVESWLQNIDMKIKMSHAERVSIYFADNNSFYILGRYSKNPKLEKIHTQKFPLDKGVLSRAWEQDECTEFNCPVHEDDSEGYINHIHKEYGYDHSKISGFTMRSCDYLGISIKDRGKNIGVIIFESESRSLENKYINIKEVIDSYNEQIRGLIVDGQDYEHVLSGNGSVGNSTEAEVIKELGVKVVTRSPHE